METLEGFPPNTSMLPIQISAIKKFIWSYSVDITTTGSHNLATSLWMTHTGKTGLTPNIGDIATEFMIWTDGYSFIPAGTILGTTVINGATFEVWHNPVQADNSGINSNTWNYVAYRMTTPSLTVILDIKQILNDAVSRGIIPASDYVSDVEFGNEIASGSGQTWIKSMSLDVQ